MNWTGLVAGGVFFLVFAIHFINHSPDDIWISLRYAENLARGHGLAFNPGERVEGYSNFLWVLVMGAFVSMTTKAQLTLVAKLIGGVCGLLSLFVVARIARRHPLTAGSFRFWGAAPAALGFTGYLGLWSASGMETGFYVLLLLLSALVFFAFVRSGGGPTGVLSALLFLAVALTRPEGAIFFAAAVCTIAFGRFGENRRLTGNEFLFALAFSVGYVAFLLWRYSYFGQWLPNTFYAKATGGGRQLVEGARYLLVNLPRFLWANPVLALALVLPFALEERLSRELVFVGACILMQCAFVVVVGGDWMDGARFLVPAMPAAALLVPAALDTFSRSDATPRTARRSWRFRSLLAAVAMACALIHVYSVSRVYRDESGFRACNESFFFNADHFAVAQWLRENARQGDLLASSEAGLIPYLTELPFLDTIGLVDSHMAHQPGLCHEKTDNDYLFRRKPEFIMLSDCTILGDRIYTQVAWVRDMLDDPRLDAEYDYVFAQNRFRLYRRRHDAPRSDEVILETEAPTTPAH